MFMSFASNQHRKYNQARSFLVKNPEILIELEKYILNVIGEGILSLLGEIKQDYDEASHLYPFWKNYPPDERGRKPRGDHGSQGHYCKK
jgi:uncharacterized protein YbcI